MEQVRVMAKTPEANVTTASPGESSVTSGLTATINQRSAPFSNHGANCAVAVVPVANVLKPGGLRLEPPRPSTPSSTSSGSRPSAVSPHAAAARWKPAGDFFICRTQRSSPWANSSCSLASRLRKAAPQSGYIALAMGAWADASLAFIGQRFRRHRQRQRRRTRRSESRSVDALLRSSVRPSATVRVSPSSGACKKALCFASNGLRALAQKPQARQITEKPADQIAPTVRITTHTGLADLAECHPVMGLHPCC